MEYDTYDACKKGKQKGKVCHHKSASKVRNRSFKKKQSQLQIIWDNIPDTLYDDATQSTANQ
jgi:hypothetical protein